MTTPSTDAVGREGRSPAPDGVVVVDKPQGWTSHDVVARTRRLAATRKVGHAGTLDPMATGVLVLGIGRATKLLTYVVGADKEYLATVRLGQATTTDDAEGEVLTAAGAPDVARAALEEHVNALSGAIEQVPSAVSAIKVDGKRAYARVRSGEQVELAARPVTISRFEVLELRSAQATDGTVVTDVDVLVECSSGTYVRALARDLGAGLGVGGHLTALRRTRVGGYGLDVARSLEQLGESFDVLPLDRAARAILPARELTAAETRELSFGRPLEVAPTGPSGTRETPVAAFAPDGALVALLADERGKSRPVLVIAAA